MHGRAERRAARVVLVVRVVGGEQGVFPSPGRPRLRPALPSSALSPVGTLRGYTSCLLVAPRPPPLRPAAAIPPPPACSSRQAPRTADEGLSLDAIIARLVRARRRSGCASSRHHPCGRASRPGRREGARMMIVPPPHPAIRTPPGSSTVSTLLLKAPHQQDDASSSCCCSPSFPPLSGGGVALPPPSSPPPLAAWRPAPGTLLVAPPAPAPAPPNCTRRRAATAASNSCVVRCVNLFEQRQRSHSILSLWRRLSAAFSCRARANSTPARRVAGWGRP